MASWKSLHEQFSRIEPNSCRFSAAMSRSATFNVVNAILFVAENGCKWRSLPKRFGNWHTIYTRMNRWAKAGVLDRLVRGIAASAAGAHQDRSGESGQHHRQSTSGWHRCSKKNGAQAIGKSRAGWSTKIHMVAAHARCAVAFSLWPDKPAMRPRVENCCAGMPACPMDCRLIMDRAYEGNETRQLALDLGFIPVVPPLCTRVEPWQLRQGYV